jgi:hypothetical protein
MTPRAVLAASAVAAALLAGVVGAALVAQSASSPAVSSAPSGTAPVPSPGSVPVASDGPSVSRPDPVAGSDRADSGSCLGGICVDELPDPLPFDAVPGYLEAVRLGLVAAGTPEAATACHTVTHEIGRHAARGADPVELLDLDDGACLYGYQHGVLEGWSLRSSTETVSAAVATVCAVYDKGFTRGGITAAEADYARGSCAHGLGHAIALQYPPSIRAALEMCDPAGEGRRSGCAGGVFMAYGSGDASQGGSGDDPALVVSRDEVLSLCVSLAGEYRSECWAKLWMLADAVDIPVADLAAMCPSAMPDVQSCGHGLGVALSYDSGLDWRVAAAGCAGPVESYCLLGVAWSNANTHVGAGQSAASHLSICAQLPRVDAAACAAEERAALNGAAPA